MTRLRTVSSYAFASSILVACGSNGAPSGVPDSSFADVPIVSGDAGGGHDGSRMEAAAGHDSGQHVPDATIDRTPPADVIAPPADAPHEASAEAAPLDAPTSSDAPADATADATPGDAGSHPDGGTSDAANAKDAHADAGCGAGEKSCGGACVAIDDPAYGCGTTGCTSCTSSNACFGSYACAAGACSGSNPVTCHAEDQCHVAGACVPATGMCTNPNATDGTACNDGNPCHSDDTCQAGVCTAGSTCSVCSDALSAFFGMNTTGWNFEGDASYDTGAETAVLVDGSVTSGQAGSIVYKDAILVDSMTVQFDFKFTTVNGRADGLMFFIETTGNTAIGQGYGGFGALGLTGYGVELDIFDSGPCDGGNGNHAGIDYLTSCAGGDPPNSGIPDPVATSADLFNINEPDNGVGDIGDGTTRTATITFASGVVSVSITGGDGTFEDPNLQNVALPGYVAGTKYFVGFGGGSGSNNQASRVEISNVALTFGADQCL